MSHSLTTLIEKLMYWRGGSWVRHDQKGTCVLRILYDQLLITADTKIVESLNMNGKMKGFYKNDALILVLCNDKEIRKLKFLIKGDVNQCVQLLGQHFPVVNHGALNKNVTVRYRNLNEVFKSAVEAMERQETNSLPMPANFNNFLRLCLLDPTFPQFVCEAQKILEKDILNE